MTLVYIKLVELKLILGLCWSVTPHKFEEVTAPESDCFRLLKGELSG